MNYIPYEIKTVFLTFLRTFFSNQDETNFQWIDDEKTTRLKIVDEYTIDINSINKPTILLRRLPFGVGNAVNNQMSAGTLQQGFNASNKMELFNGSVVLLCCSRQSLEAEELQWITGFSINIYKDILYRNGPIHFISGINFGSVELTRSDSESVLFTAAVTVNYSTKINWKRYVIDRKLFMGTNYSITEFEDSGVTSTSQSVAEKLQVLWDEIISIDFEDVITVQNNNEIVLPSVLGTDFSKELGDVIFPEYADPVEDVFSEECATGDGDNLILPETQTDLEQYEGKIIQLKFANDDTGFYLIDSVVESEEQYFFSVVDEEGESPEFNNESCKYKIFETELLKEKLYNRISDTEDDFEVHVRLYSDDYINEAAEGFYYKTRTYHVSDIGDVDNPVFSLIETDETSLEGYNLLKNTEEGSYINAKIWVVKT